MNDSVAALPPAHSTQAATPSSRPWAWLLIASLIAVLITLVAFVIVGLQIADLRTRTHRLDNDLMQQSTQQQQQQLLQDQQLQQWMQAHPQITHQLQQLTQQQAVLQQQLAQVNQQLSQWQSQFSQTPLRRQINELEDLLQHAHRHLLFTGAVQQTQVLLDQAYQACLRFNSSLLEPACQLIKQDEQSLKDYKAFDSSQVLQQLNQLETRLQAPLLARQQLTFNQSGTSETTNQVPTPPVQGIEYIQQKLQAASHKLGRFISDNLVQVHKLEDRPDRYQLHLPELDELSTHLGLLFQQARTALIIQNRSIYQSTLQEINTFSHKLSELPATDLSDIQTELDQLQQLAIDQAPPTSLKAHELLQRLLNSLDNKPVAATDAENAQEPLQLNKNSPPTPTTQE